MTDITIDAGTLHFSEDDLSATGLLVPYGVKARSNLGEFEVEPGVFEIPTDTTGSSLNIEHRREDVVGGITRAWEQPEAGILAAFRFKDTAEGRRAFQDAKEGKRRHLSVEASGVKIRGGKATAGRIFAASLVTKPAFDGATLLAAEDTDPLAVPAPDAEPTPLEPDGEGNLAILSTEIPTDITVTTPAGSTAEFTPVSAPEPANTEGGSTVTASDTTTEQGQTTGPVTPMPTTLLASAPVATTKDDKEIDLGSIFAAMAVLKKGLRDEDSETLLAALSDIKYNATGGLTTSASGVLQPSWVGRLWQGRRYQRKWLDLFTHTYGGIQLGGRKGFKLNQGTALVTKWSGNKSEIGSGTASTTTASATLQAYGYAADVAREWYDLEGGAEVLQAFFEGVVDSYGEVTDTDALTAIFNTAAKSSTDLDRLVAPDTDIPTDYPQALGLVIQAVEAVQDADDDPNSVIVNPVAWKQLVYTPKDQIPEFITFGIRPGGEGSADSGKVVVRKAPAAAFVGLDATEPAVIGGAKRAIEFREQGSTPIQIDALDIAKGGIDKAVIGYLETLPVRPESLVLIGTEAA